MPRRKHKRVKRQGSREPQEFANSLEEDLRQQRLRQQKKKEEEEKKQEDSKATTDDDCDTQWDVLSQPNTFSPQHLMLQGDRLPWSERLSPNFSMDMYMTRQQSPLLTVQRRGRLQYWAISKHMTENMRVNRRASNLYTKRLKWLSHTLPDGMNCTWDMACKYHVHPSARTLDVACLADEMGEMNSLPHVATIVREGWGLFRPPSRFREDCIHTWKSKPVFSIRMHEKSGALGVTCQNSVIPQTNTFQFYNLPSASSCLETQLDTRVNDFCFGNDLVLFACPRYGWNSSGSQSLLTPLFMSLGHGASLRSINVNNFPQSDALRVEMTCHHEKYLAFGHRNGEVSIMDLRQTQSCTAVLTSNQSAAEHGSVTDLGFLRSEKELLVKRGFGPCQLHDLRKLSKEPTSLLRSFCPPAESMAPAKKSFHKTLSANCNGFCLDPATEQTLVVPFINQLHEPCLGIWNLTTGESIGTRVLYENPHKEVYFVELCQRTTPAFQTGTTLDHSSFGVWFKCGKFSLQRQNPKLGSLHHMTLPGDWDPILMTVPT